MSREPPSAPAVPRSREEIVIASPTSSSTIHVKKQVRLPIESIDVFSWAMAESESTPAHTWTAHPGSRSVGRRRQLRAGSARPAGASGASPRSGANSSAKQGSASNRRWSGRWSEERERKAPSFCAPPRLRAARILACGARWRGKWTRPAASAVRSNAVWDRCTRLLNRGCCEWSTSFRGPRSRGRAHPPCQSTKLTSGEYPAGRSVSLVKEDIFGACTGPLTSRECRHERR